MTGISFVYSIAKCLEDLMVQHIYQMEDGLIRRMEMGEDRRIAIGGDRGQSE